VRCSVPEGWRSTTSLEKPEEDPRPWEKRVQACTPPLFVPVVSESTKTKGIMKQLDAWRRNHPDDKIVLFSAFTKMLDITEKVLDDSGEWDYGSSLGSQPLGLGEQEWVGTCSSRLKAITRYVA
jgi:SNF2 family DNA or RNA helicase